MRVLQVVTDRDRRGAQVFATDLGSELAQRDHVVRTVALAPGDSSNPLDLEVLGQRRRSPGTLRALRRLFDSSDVVIGHGSATLLACAIAGVGKPAPFVYRQISDIEFWAGTRLRRTRVRLGLREARRVVALCQFNKAQLVDYLGFDGDRVVVIPNGVRSDRFPFSDPGARAVAKRTLGLPDRPVVSVVGALVPEKGVDLAIRSVVSLPSVQLVIAGDGPERANLEELARRVAADRVTFLGSISDSQRIYAASDVVVLSSRGGDSMPAALIEAGLSGLPTVATSIGGVPEIVADGRTGIVVVPDDVSALHQAVAKLVGDPGLASRLGQQAREASMQYDIRVVARAWENALVSVI